MRTSGLEEHFVTVFDYGFAPQGLALYRSLSKFASPFKLWVIALDADLENLLNRLAFPNLIVVAVGDIETPELRKVKLERSSREYCWTLTPFLFSAVFNRSQDINRVTYVDADIWIRGNVKPIFSELETSGKAVQITEHAFSPEQDVSALYGRYCVQFQTMYRRGTDFLLERWQQQCLDWCFARTENGKFGDQKYLDEWPIDFGNTVHVAQNRQFFLGPWNVNRFPFSDSVTYHFHQLRINPDATEPHLGSYSLPVPVRKWVYEPYVQELREIQTIMKELGFRPIDQFQRHTLWQRVLKFLAPLTDGAYRTLSTNRRWRGNEKA